MNRNTLTTGGCGMALLVIVGITYACVYQDPTAVISNSSPQYAVKGQGVNFDGRDSYDNDEGGASIVSYQWTGDLTASGATPFRSFASAGFKYIYLKVIDDEGADSKNDPYCVVIVSEVREICNDWYETGDQYVRVGGSIDLYANSNPDNGLSSPYDLYYFPPGQPTWSIKSQPSGSSATSTTWTSDKCIGGGHDGFTASNLDKPGTYVIHAQAGSADSGDDINVIAVELRIESPKSKSDVSQYKDAFRSTPPYCFENQGVTSGCLGNTNVQSIVGVVLPGDVSYAWFLDASAGTISPLTGSLTPTHSSPATAGTGTLTLYLVDDPAICDTAEIEIYGDHLARDTANFTAGKACVGPSGLQLADGSYVSGASLTCASAANHALKGATGSGTDLRALTKVVDKEPWADFVNRSLSRGQILELYYRAPSGNPAFLHWQTVVSSGTGASAGTYAADSVTQVFRYETAGAYYALSGVAAGDRWVTVYNP